MQSTKKTDIEEVVKIVVYILNSSENLVRSVSAAKQKYLSTHFDHCDFKCGNKELMLSNMYNQHEECNSFDLCGKYFGTKQFLKHHNKLVHNTNDTTLKTMLKRSYSKKTMT